MNLFNWMSFDSFTHPWNRNHAQDIENFHYYQKIPCVPFLFIRLTLEQYKFERHGPLTCTGKYLHWFWSEVRALRLWRALIHATLYRGPEHLDFAISEGHGTNPPQIPRGIISWGDQELFTDFQLPGVGIPNPSVVQGSTVLGNECCFLFW